MAYEEVTSPIMLDSTGQQIHSDLQQIKNVLTTPSAAADITFDNTGTGMQADDVQDAITELKSNLTELNSGYICDDKSEAVSANTFTDILSINVTKGTWLITSYMDLSSSVNSNYGHYLNNGLSLHNKTIRTNGGSGGGSVATSIIEFPSATTVTVSAYVGSAVTVRAHIEAIKLR